MAHMDEGIRVWIFGDEYTVKSDVDQETTKRVADYVGLKIAETQKHTVSRDKVKVAVLSAMNITGEYFEAKKESETNRHMTRELTEIAERISRRIDSQLSL